ncbi:ribosome silencing factor [Kribbella deserti]|uniref:ribosome silencing factor n=1 Tax=Kribbella deserti TaxID=1926257 RepID=UPI00406BD769
MPATERAVELLIAAAEAAHDKKAENVLAFDVSEQLAITDAFLVASASNDRQVRAIVDAIEEKLRTLDAKPVRREGAREGRWVLLDYLEIVVHVQHDEERSFYSLERLWRDCPIIPLPNADGTMPAPAPASDASASDAAPASDSDASGSDDAPASAEAADGTKAAGESAE